MFLQDTSDYTTNIQFNIIYIYLFIKNFFSIIYIYDHLLYWELLEERVIIRFFGVPFLVPSTDMLLSGTEHMFAEWTRTPNTNS